VAGAASRRRGIHPPTQRRGVALDTEAARGDPLGHRGYDARIRVLTARRTTPRSTFTDKVISERWSSRTGSDLRRENQGRHLSAGCRESRCRPRPIVSQVGSGEAEAERSSQTPRSPVSAARCALLPWSKGAGRRTLHLGSRRRCLCPSGSDGIPCLRGAGQPLSRGLLRRREQKTPVRVVRPAPRNLCTRNLL
jgi:hypothetical protein